MIQAWFNKIIAGIALAGAGLLWLFRFQRDRAREQRDEYREQAEQANARHEQRDRADKADRDGERKTNEARRQARKEAGQGKRDHFEDGAW